MARSPYKVTVSDKFLAATFLKFLPARITPNQITMFRFFTVPFVVFLLFAEEYRWGIILFAISAFTDALDGALARTTNRVTDWGKIYDPVADKLLIVLSALIVAPRHLGIWPIVALLGIEMLTIGSAYYLKNKGTVEIMANGWGKAKMICQSLGIGMLLAYSVFGGAWLVAGGQYFIYASIFFAVMSLLTFGI